MGADFTIILVLLSKVPIYIYVVHKAYIYRKSVLLISTKWLGCLGVTGFISALFVATSNKTWAGLIAYGVIFSLFMLAYTAREIKLTGDHNGIHTTKTL